MSVFVKQHIASKSDPVPLVVCVYVCVYIILYITAQSDPVIPVILYHSH